MYELIDCLSVFSFKAMKGIRWGKRRITAQEAWLASLAYLACQLRLLPDREQGGGTLSAATLCNSTKLACAMSALVALRPSGASGKDGRQRRS